MKTIKTYIPALIFAFVMAGWGILKAQPENHQDDIFLQRLFLNQPEEKVAPLPFNTAAIASEALFQKLEKEYFLNLPEEEVAPLPEAVKKTAYRLKMEKAWNLISVVEDEPEIDDLPPAVKQFMVDYQKKLLAQTAEK
jgi:hypothetical protein